MGVRGSAVATGDIEFQNTQLQRESRDQEATTIVNTTSPSL